jgi:hypothetical protein
MGPLAINELITENTNLLLAFFIGIGFGFVLEQGGFSSSRKLAGVFYGYDTVVLKVFFTGAITAMLGLLFFSLFGWIDMDLVYINETFLWSSIVGGVIMGTGFIMGGYCPGTSFCGAAIGKIDAIIFILGLFIGIFIFGEAFSFFEPLFLAKDMGSPKISEFFGISEGFLVLIVIIAAILMFWIGEWAEKKFPREEY